MDNASTRGYVRLAMQLTKTTRSFLALTVTGILFATACGDGDDGGMDVKDDGETGGTSTGGRGGTSTGGTSTGGTSTGGTSTGGTSTGGSSGNTTGGTSGTTTGGNAGMAGSTTGGSGGRAGGGAGGTAGAGGMAGAGAGAGGMAGAGAGAGGMAGGGMAGAGAGGLAGAGAGGLAGAGGMAGGGMGGMAPTVVHDFESGVQGWGGNTSQSTDQHLDGANSLKVTHGALDNGNLTVGVNNPPVWPGTVLTFNVFFPSTFDPTGKYFQAYAQADNFNIGFETGGNSARTAVPGAWTTWTYTVPNTFPGGFQRLGFQLGDNSGGTTIAAGDFYIDAITATGGVANCAIATPAGLHDFETPWDPPPAVQVYQVDGAPSDNPVAGMQTTIARSTTRALTGSASLGVTFTSLPAPTGTDPTKRIVFINKPVVYCGQTMTFRVFLPTGSDGLTFQVFAQYNNFGAFTGTGPVTVTRDAWNVSTYTIPTSVGPGGIQRVGVEFQYSGTTPYSGEVSIDQVTW